MSTDDAFKNFSSRRPAILAWLYMTLDQEIKDPDTPWSNKTRGWMRKLRDDCWELSGRYLSSNIDGLNPEKFQFFDRDGPGDCWVNDRVIDELRELRMYILVFSILNSDTVAVAEQIENWRLVEVMTIEAEAGELHQEVEVAASHQESRKRREQAEAAPE